MWSSQMDEEQLLENQTPEHKELMNRVLKTLYFGGLKMPKCKVLTKPLSELVASETFNDTHPPYSLQPETVGQIKASPCSLILALIYLDLLKELDPQYVRRMPPSELLLVAMMVSTKFYSGYDEDVSISDWAEYGNLSVDRLKALEIDFLSAMDWKIYVSNEAFFKKLKDIECILAEREIKTRGWLTYTELCTLMPSIEVIRKAISYSALLAVSYTAGVIALAGAFFVASQVPGSYLCDRMHPKTPTAVVTGEAPLNETAIVDSGTVTQECRPGGGSCVITVSGQMNYSELEELEQRLILRGMEWEPLSNADEDGKRIHLNRGTDYWTPTASPGGQVPHQHNDTENENRTWLIIDEDNGGREFHGIVQRRENDSGHLWDGGEWAPVKSNHHDLSFLSYLWFKFL